MTTLSVDLIIEELGKWVGNYIKSSGKKIAVVKWDDSPNSALAIKVCHKARSFHNTLSISVCINDKFPILEAKVPCNVYFRDNDCEVASEENGIIIGLCDKTEVLNRNYSKRYDEYDNRVNGNADIFPLLDIYHSEVIDLVDTIFPELKVEPLSAEDSMIEWATKLNLHNGIVTDTNLPNKHPDWYKFTKNQKEFIAKIHQREKNTRHKCLRNSNYCKLRSLKTNLFA